MNKKFEYPALLVRQGPNSPPLVLFSASAVEMDEWVGIPQKKQIQDGETIGFQRDDNPARVTQIAQFYGDANNVIHNPLLCAIRRKVGTEVSFVPEPNSDANSPHCPGTLHISFPDRSAEPFWQLFRQARLELEERVPELKEQPDPLEKIELIRVQSESPLLASDDIYEDLESDDEDTEVGGDDADGTDSVAPPQEALFETSHVSDFWAELKAREVWLEKLPDYSQKTFVGFSRDAVDSFLRPVVLVDGQHRLLGALKAAEDSIDEQSDAYIKDVDAMLKKGKEASAVRTAILAKHARRLPISLLLDDNPGEHVFQFVIVNQKATPVRPALLGTIISTSLSEAELEPISARLQAAGVPLENSRAMSYLARNPESPFAGLVSRGFETAGTDQLQLQWSVLGQLVNVFRNLRGAKFFHQTQSRFDAADAWKRRWLPRSGIVGGDPSDWKAAADAWSKIDGPWRSAFIVFWSTVRDKLANLDNPDAPNAWGRPRTSNLFNKPMLLTLTTDYFTFLNDTRVTFQNTDDVKKSVDDWLLDVSPNYFARDWQLSGIKKDSVGTRKQWSKLWADYRRDPKQLPQARAFSQPYKAG